MRSVRIGTLVAAAALASAGCATAPQVKKEPQTKTVAAPPRPVEKSVAERFKEAVQAFQAGDLSRAREGFTAVLKKQPDSVAAQYNLGVVAEKEGKLAEAQSQYESALKLDPTHKPSLLNLGRLYRLQDRFQELITLYEPAVKDGERAHDVELLNNLTVAYRLTRQYDKAEATARRVLERSKDDPEAYKNLALVYYDQGNYPLARFVTEKAYQLDEKDPGVYNLYGMILLKLNDRSGALTQFKKAVSLSDAFAPGYVNIGAMALSYRDYATAETAFRRAVELDPASYESQLYLAYALDGQKGRDSKKGLAAGEAYEKVLALRAEQPDAICGAGWAYAADKQGYQKALPFLEKCKTLPSLQEVDRQKVDVKLKSLAQLMKAGQPQPAADDKKTAQRPAGQSGMIEKVSAEEEAREGTTPAPEGATRAPDGNAAPDGAASPQAAPQGTGPQAAASPASAAPAPAP